MSNEAAIIRHTKNWLSTIVIAHTLCPFAKREFDHDSIHYAVIQTPDLREQLEHIQMELTALDHKPGRETSVLIFPEGLCEFEDYLQMLDIAAELLKAEGYEGLYQLASFHPKYRFNDSDDDDVSNYTNRSPYPMVHILREASVEIALAAYPNPEQIPEKNVKKLETLGLTAMKSLLADCYK